MNNKFFCIAMVAASIAGAHSAQAVEYATLIEAARTDFQSIDDQDVQLAFAEVQAAQQAIAHRFLARGPSVAQGWKDYLLWDQQRQQLLLPHKRDTVFWKKVYLRELRSAPGLDYPVFQQHRAATRTLVNVLQSADEPSLHQQYHAALDRLSPLLDRGPEILNNDQTAELALLVEQLDKNQQAPQLIRTIKNSFSHHNVLVYIPNEYFGNQKSSGIQQPFPVSDCVAGAKVCGSGVVTASYEWAPVANSNTATWQIDVHGSTASRTVAYKDRVSVRSKSTMPFHTQGNVKFDLTGFRVANFTTSGKMRIRPTSIHTSYRGLRRLIARRRTLKQQAKTRCISQRKALKSLSQSFQQEVATDLQDFNHRYYDEILRPLLCFDQSPTDSSFRTTSNSVHVGLRFANPHQLAASHDLEDFYQGQHLRLAIHQSAANNLATSLAGRKRSLAKTLRQFAPDAAQQDVVEGPDVQITFADLSPVKISLHNGQVGLRILGDRFVRDGQEYNAMEIGLNFTIHKEDNKLFLVLDGEPVIAHPPRLDGTRPKLGIRDLSLRRILNSIFKRDLPKKIALDELDMLSGTSFFDPLQISNLETENGWAVLEAAMPPRL